MATMRNADRKYKYYICGQCKTPIEYLSSDEPPIPCPDCGGYNSGYKSAATTTAQSGWRHGARDKYDVPENIKYRIK